MNEVPWPVYDSSITIRTQRCLAALRIAMEVNLPEDEAIRYVSETYGISPEVAQTFLDFVEEHPDPDEW